MGGRGQGGGGSGGITSKGGDFDKLAEQVFLKYDMDRQGGELVFKKVPPANDMKWIETNKEKLILWKQKIDLANEKVRQRFRELKELVMIRKEVIRDKKIYYAYTYRLNREGLRLNVMPVKSRVVNYRGKPMLIEDLIEEKLKGRLGIQDTYIIEKSQWGIE